MPTACEVLQVLPNALSSHVVELFNTVMQKHQQGDMSLQEIDTLVNALQSFTRSQTFYDPAEEDDAHPPKQQRSPIQDTTKLLSTALQDLLVVISVNDSRHFKKNNHLETSWKFTLVPRDENCLSRIQVEYICKATTVALSVHCRELHLQLETGYGRYYTCMPQDADVVNYSTSVSYFARLLIQKLTSSQPGVKKKFDALLKNMSERDIGKSLLRVLLPSFTQSQWHRLL